MKRVIVLKKNGRLSKFLKYTVSALILSLAVICVARRIPECFGAQNPAVLAAAITLNKGEIKNIEETKPTDNKTESSEAIIPTENNNTIDSSERDKSDYYNSFARHEGEEKYSIEERTIAGGATQVDSCYIKNKTGLDLDFDSILNEKLSFDIKKNDSPQVLIYHTHTGEAYIDEDVDFFYDSFYSRTRNNDFNVVAVGEQLAKSLESRGIKVIHDKTIHDSSYNGSYDRSVQTVFSDMEKYKDIKVVLDIHRDAIGTETNKVKPVFEYKGKKGAQIMILAGCDAYGERGFDNWQKNLSFALKIQNTAEKMYPNMTRPISFDFFAYNEYVCDGSLLIEVGAEANSIDEAQYTAQLLGNVLYEVLK